MLKENLRRLLKERGLTLYKLAKVTGLNISTLWRIYQGTTKDPGIRTMGKIAKGLGVRVEDLVG